MNPILFPYCEPPRHSLSSIHTIEEGIKVIGDLLAREVLCPHDVMDLNHAYQVINQFEQKTDPIAHKDSRAMLQRLTDKVKEVHQASSPGQIITTYYLRKFEPFVMNPPLDSLSHFTLEANKIHEIATQMPYCSEKKDFEADVENLLGKEFTEEVTSILQAKKERISQREQARKQEEIQKRLSKLHYLRTVNTSVYPSYLEEILQQGFFHLYDHLIHMKQIPTQAERENQEKTLSFSTFSHIVLQFKEMVLTRAEQLIVPGSPILFLLGDTGSGKSTTLCYLRKEGLILKNSSYHSINSGEHLIGNHETVSCTLFPNIFVSSDLTLVDFPGFNDTHGQVISLAIELTLRMLAKKYSPNILILSSITDTESRFNHALKLGQRLKRILGTLDHCTLGLTKYVNDPDFINIKNIEEGQKKELLAPSREESSLTGQISVLLSLVHQLPHLQKDLDQKQQELLTLEQQRLSFDPNLLSDTESKKYYREALRQKEETFKSTLGVQKMIALADLMDQKKLEVVLNRLKCMQTVAALPRYHTLDARDKEFLRILFQDKVIHLIQTHTQRSLSVSPHQPSDRVSSRTRLLDQVKAFEKKILETSLISTLLHNTHPEIGQFFHLEEMDPAIVRDYDTKVIERCIKDYIQEVIADLIVLKEVIEKCKQQFSKEHNQIIDQEFSALKRYILTLSIGLSEQANEAKIAQAWAGLQQEHESRMKNREKDLELSGVMTGILLVALGIPYGIFRVFKAVKLNQADTMSKKEMATELSERIKDIMQALKHLKEIEWVVKNKERFDEIITRTPLVLDSVPSLERSLRQQIDQAKNIYGKGDWEARVMLIIRQLEELFASAEVCVLYALMAQESPFKELPFDVNQPTFLALMHAVATSSQSYQESLKKLIPGWEKSDYHHLDLTNPQDFFDVPAIKEEEYEELKIKGRALLEQYQTTLVTKLLFIDAVKRLRERQTVITRQERNRCWSQTLEEDREKLLRAVKENVGILDSSQAWLQSDRLFILLAVKRNAKVFTFAHQALQRDREFILEAVRLNETVLDYVTGHFMQDAPFALEAIGLNEKAVAYVSKVFKHNTHFVLTALKQTAKAFPYVSKELKDDPGFLAAAIEQNKKVLPFVNEELKKQQL
ncbi:MAG: DUF4116 domain-containing protein [Candidatus Rhabdochlamydia sp.]